MARAATCHSQQVGWPRGGKGVSIVPGEILMGEAAQFQMSSGNDDEFSAEARTVPTTLCGWFARANEVSP